MKVAIFFGSKSDIDVLKGAGNALKEFGIPYNEQLPYPLYLLHIFF